jgi:thiaminase/transcriptional activator TenA
LSLTEKLRQKHAGLWEEMVTHPFVQGLGSGDLPLEQFQRYFLQDFVFVRDLVKLVSLIMAKAPDLDTARRLTRFLGDLLSGEETLFRDAFRDWGISETDYLNVEAAPETRAFGDFIVRTSYEGSFPEALACLVLPEWTYLDWATRLAQGGQLPENPVYRGWIEIHSNAEFTGFVTWLRERLDAAPMDEETRDRVSRIFLTSLRYELQFWEGHALHPSL